MFIENEWLNNVADVVHSFLLMCIWKTMLNAEAEYVYGFSLHVY